MKMSSFVVLAALLASVTAFASLFSPLASRSALAQSATPGPAYSCETISGADASPAAMDHGAMAGMEMASPEAGMAMEMGIDVLYIDMMIPHHASIIALAEAALPDLTDDRLRELAQSIIDAQSAEIEELGSLRMDIAGSAMPAPMDDMTMGMMMELMPGMGSMEEMAVQMDPAAQVAAFCAAANPDLAFIELTIPHHEMAIAASEALLEQSSNDELRAFAERVIADQQAEIDQLTPIREELGGS